MPESYIGVGGQREKVATPEEKLVAFMESWLQRRFAEKRHEASLGQELADELAQIIPALTDRAVATKIFRQLEKIGEYKLLSEWQGVMGEVAALEMFVRWWGEGNVFKNKELDANKVDVLTVVEAPVGADYEIRVVGWQVKVNPEFECRLLDGKSEDLLVGMRGEREVRLNPKKMMTVTERYLDTTLKGVWGLNEEAELNKVRTSEPGIHEVYDDFEQRWVKIKVEVGYIGIPVESVSSMGRARGEAWVNLSNGEVNGLGEQQAKTDVTKLLGLTN